MRRVGIGAVSERDPTRSIEQRNRGGTVDNSFPCGYACGGDCDCDCCELYPQSPKPQSPLMQSVLYKL